MVRACSRNKGMSKDKCSSHSSHYESCMWFSGAEICEELDWRYWTGGVGLEVLDWMSWTG